MKVTPISKRNISFKTFAKPQSNLLPNVFSEFQRDGFVSVPIEKTIEKKTINKKAIAGVVLTSLVGICVVALSKNKNKIKNFIEVEELKKYSRKLNDLFPQDAKYRSKITTAIGLGEKESYKLSSIVGVEELTKVTKEFEQNPIVYSPGTPNYNYFDAVSHFNNENVNSRLFGANMHFHTDNSDGVLSVKELLEKTVEYADKRFEKLKKPFYLAITDHDTVNGCKEAVEIISKNPKKYKNLKLILGIENTFMYKNPELLHDNANIHVLSYGINPYSDELVGLIGDKVKKNISNIKNAIFAANEKFKPMLSKSGVEYQFEDMPKISKAIGVGIKNSTFYMKDYLQFKYIFTKNVLNNNDLCSELANAGVNISDIDFSKPIKLISKKPDYSSGQKYYDYYYKATKEYISSLVEGVSKSKVQKLLPDITLQDRVFLQKIEEEALTPYSLIYVKPNDFFSFEEGIEKLSKLEDGVMGMAHPGVFFPIDVLKYKKRMPDMYEDLYRIFKEKGGTKAMFAEDNYQVYYQSNKGEMYNKLKDIASKHGLIKTGGLDTHGTDIFSV